MGIRAERKTMNTVWAVISINETDDGTNAWVYHEFEDLKLFATKEAAEKYVASQRQRSARVLEYIIREEELMN